MSKYRAREEATVDVLAAEIARRVGGLLERVRREGLEKALKGLEAGLAPLC